MATDPAPAAPSRRLWQLPTFVIGACALWAMWNHGDRLRPSVADRFESAVAALRPAVDRCPADLDQVQAALRMLPAGEPPPERAAQVRYLTGSGYVALAEAAGSDAEAAELWAVARKNLEAVPLKDLHVNDLKKLKDRLARAWFHAPDIDPNQKVTALAEGVRGAEDPSEGYQLLARLYRDGPTRDEAKERDSLQSYLKHATTRADARTLNEARVRLAALHARLGAGGEARRVLERVGPEAPPEVYADARLQLAGFHKVEQDWAATAKALEQVRDMKGATDAQHAEARLRLAEAYAKLGRTGDAEAVIRGGKADEPGNPAMLFQRAKLRLKDPAAPRDAVVQDLEAALGGDGGEAGKRVSPAEAREVCVEAYENAKAAGDFPTAVRAATVFAKVAEGGAGHALLAEAHAGLAAGTSGDEARDHYLAAAAACEAAAKADGTPVGQGDWLRRAAGYYLKAGDRSRGLAVLGELTKRLTDYPEEKAGQVWAQTGDLYLAIGDKAHARQAYENAAKRTGPAQDHARVRWAALYHEAAPGQPGPAVLLEEIVNRPAERRNPAVHEEALYLLGEVYLLNKEWERAGERLQSALTTYPTSARAPRGRYQFGQVLRHGAYEAAGQMKADRAALEAIKKEQIATRQPALKVDDKLKLEDRLDRAEKTFLALMRSAYDEFRQADEQFPATPDADPDAVKRAGFWAADCAFWLGEFKDGAARCEKLRERYRGHVEELEAGRALYRCCVFAAEAARDTKDTDGPAVWAKRASAARQQVQEALARLPAAEMDGTAEPRKRAYWDGWLADTAGK